MSHSARRRARILAMVVTFLAPIALPRPACAQELIGFEIMEWKQELSGTQRVDGDLSNGTETDLQDDLGLDPDDTLTQGRIWLHLPQKHYILYTFYDSKRTGEALLTSPLVFADALFAPGDTVKTKVELDQDSLLYRYEFIQSPTFRFGIPLGAQRFTVRSEVESSLTGIQRDASGGGTFPVIGASFSFTPFPWLAFSAEALGMNLALSGNDYRFYDARGQAEIHFAPLVGLVLGYRQSVNDSTLEDFGVVDFQTNGPFATLLLAF
ncbi:MAG TPA: hypothetical protein VFW45_04525 [Candidatus Polarisedimenticolia bacterium]|nr:hypothetical protein [Candidatus Polarisedimenticolia bacterium]